jgi:hypothetical protein
MIRRIQLALLALCLVLFSTPVSAHSGRTDSSGGHNCSSASKAKGLCSGYHYHNGGGTSSGSSSSNSSSTDTSTSAKTASSPKAAEEKLPDNAVKITFPSYGIHVNGQSIDNKYSKYPLFVYKDITYFPMTWNYTQTLGLRTAWSAETGFAISKDESIPFTTNVKLDTGSYIIPGSTATATFPEFNVFLNDKWVDNSQEEYPVLTYKDVTYFPMTWNFAVEELGLTTKWDDTEGFSITRPSKN